MSAVVACVIWVMVQLLWTSGVLAYMCTAVHMYVDLTRYKWVKKS